MITKPAFKLVEKANGFGDVWELTQEMKNEHPAPFPIKKWRLSPKNGSYLQKTAAISEK